MEHNYQQSIYGEIPSDWRIDSLKDVCVKEEGILTGPFGSQLHQKDYQSKGTPIITVEHLGENYLFHSDLPRVSDSDYKRLSRYSLQAGDIVFSRVGSVDRRALVREEETGWLFSGRCLRVRPNRDVINPEFLSWFFGLPIFKDYVRRIAVGATMPSLNTALLSNVEIIVPPLPEQNLIARTLSSLTDNILLNNKMNKTLEAIGQAVFKRGFIDFEFPNEEGKPYKSSGGEMVDAGEIGKEIPKGWKVGRIEDVADVVGGGTPSTKVESYFTNTGIHWLTPKDLSGFEGKFIDKGVTDITEEGLKNSSAKLMPKGTILFTSRAPIGYVAIALNSITTNQGFKSLIPKNKMQTEYLYQYLRLITPHIQSISCGSTFGEISGRAMKGIEIVIPEKLGVEKFEEFMAPVNSRIINNVFSVRTLKEIRDSLLPRLMSGRIRIPVEERTADNRK